MAEFFGSGGGGNVGVFTLIVDGDGYSPGPGIIGDLVVPKAGTIQEVYLLADQAGDAVIDIWKTSYDNFPPASGDSICGDNKPSLSSATKFHDTALSGWDTQLQAGDIIRVNIDSISTITRLVVALVVKFK